MSTGDYLCFVDSDDWIDACMVEKMLDFSSDCGKEIICGNYVQEERNRSIEIYQAMEPGIYTGRSLQDRIHGKLLGQEKRPITLSRCMKLFSRTLIVENMKYCDPSIRMGEGYGHHPSGASGCAADCGHGGRSLVSLPVFAGVDGAQL